MSDETQVSPPLCPLRKPLSFSTYLLKLWPDGPLPSSGAPRHLLPEEGFQQYALRAIYINAAKPPLLCPLLEEGASVGGG